MPKIEVTFYSSNQQIVQSVRIKEGLNILQAIQASGVVEDYPEVHWEHLGTEQLSVGIFGELKPIQTIVQENDRVEIYLPLKQSAMAARKQRVKETKLKREAQK